MNFLATDIVDTSPYHSGGPVNDSMHFVFNWVLAASVILGTFTVAMLLYSMFRFRRKTEEDEPSQFHGNTRLELFWTAVPLAVFLSLFGITVSQMGFINDAPASTAAHPVMNVTVIGQQFSWTFDYTGRTTSGGNDVESFTTLYVPVDTPVSLQVVSTDPPCATRPNGAASTPQQRQYTAMLQRKVQGGESLANAISDEGCGVAHSFYVPSLAGQVNALPGQTNHMWLEAREGHYYGQCTELCGVGHASMLLEVVAMSQAKFDTWMQQQQAAK